MLSLEMSTTATIFIDGREGGIDTIEGQIVSMSPGSMGLRAIRSIAQDTKMRVTLTFVDRHGEKYEESVQGWLVWQEEASPFHLLGVIFPEMNEKENPNLIHFLSGTDQRGELKEGENRLYIDESIEESPLEGMEAT